MLPPPPPPAPPSFLHSSHQTSGNKPPADRNALLSQIRRGAQLKKAETNDRSSPVVGATVKTSLAGGGLTGNSKCNGPSPLIPPGGLFAYGMPKLKPTVSSAGDIVKPPSSTSYQAGGATSHPDSSVDPSATCRNSRPQQPSPAVMRPAVETVVARNFPSDITLKGPAPAPPLNARTRNMAAVRRSASQTSIGPKARPMRPPPNIRPPPPPKSTSALQSAANQPSAAMRPPAPPETQPSAVRRRQSFGVADSRLSTRNFVNGSPHMVHVNKMNIAPPPPPCRPPSVRPPPPPTRSPAPPAPPHRTVSHPAPPSQMKMAPLPQISPAAPPPPPMRISSVGNFQQPANSYATDFEGRFKFQNFQYFPVPDRFSRSIKMYPSKINLEKGARRQPPPPPPLSVGVNGPRCFPTSPHHQPVLHIQLESRVFANNSAHC